MSNRENVKISDQTEATNKANRQLATYLLMRKYVLNCNPENISERGLSEKEQELISRLNEQTERLHRLQRSIDEK